MFSLCLIFCGVIASPSTFPRFWIFMYRLSPFTYLVSGMLSVGLAGNEITCADNELIEFSPPSGQNCNTYMTEWFDSGFPGRLELGSGTSETTCRFCSYTNTDVFLDQINS